MNGVSGVKGRQGVTLIEICVAVGILAFCFLPIMQFSQANLRETQVSQEDLIARHFLIDMVERFKGATLAELKRLPPSELPVPLGQTPAYLEKDDILSDHQKVVDELRAKVSSTGTATDAASIVGMQQYGDITKEMMLTRLAVFKENPNPALSVHELTCIVRWLSLVGKQERRIEYSKIVVR